MKDKHGIIAAGPTFAVKDRLCGLQLQRAVIRRTDTGYESAREVLDEKGEHFEFVYSLPYDSFWPAFHRWKAQIGDTMMLGEWTDGILPEAEPEEEPQTLCGYHNCPHCALALLPFVDQDGITHYDGDPPKDRPTETRTIDKSMMRH